MGIDVDPALRTLPSDPSCWKTSKWSPSHDPSDQTWAVAIDKVNTELVKSDALDAPCTLAHQSHRAHWA
jgi:hypothetical protein